MMVIKFLNLDHERLIQDMIASSYIHDWTYSAVQHRYKCN